MKPINPLVKTLLAAGIGGILFLVLVMFIDSPQTFGVNQSFAEILNQYNPQDILLECPSDYAFNQSTNLCEKTVIESGLKTNVLGEHQIIKVGGGGGGGGGGGSGGGTPTCDPPKVIIDGVCQDPPPPECNPPQVVIDGVCQDPPPPEECNPPQVVIDGVCQDPDPTPNPNYDILTVNEAIGQFQNTSTFYLRGQYDIIDATNFVCNGKTGEVIPEGSSNIFDFLFINEKDKPIKGKAAYDPNYNYNEFEDSFVLKSGNSMIKIEVTNPNIAPGLEVGKEYIILGNFNPSIFENPCDNKKTFATTTFEFNENEPIFEVEGDIFTFLRNLF